MSEKTEGITRGAFLRLMLGAAAAVIVEPHKLVALELEENLSFEEGMHKIREAVMTEKHESGIFLVIDPDSPRGVRWMRAQSGGDHSVDNRMQAFASTAEGRLSHTGKPLIVIPIHTHNINLPVIALPNGHLYSNPPSGNDVYVAFDELGGAWPFGQRVLSMGCGAVADGGGVWTLRRKPGEKRWRLPEIPRLFYKGSPMHEWIGLNAYAHDSDPGGIQVRIKDLIRSEAFAKLRKEYDALGLELDYIPWSDLRLENLLPTVREESR